MAELEVVPLDPSNQSCSDRYPFLTTGYTINCSPWLMQKLCFSLLNLALNIQVTLLVKESFKVLQLLK